MFIFMSFMHEIQHSAHGKPSVKHWSIDSPQVIYFCYAHSLVSWVNPTPVLTKPFLHGDTQSSKGRLEALEFPCKLRAKLEYGYGFEN